MHKDNNNYRLCHDEKNANTDFRLLSIVRKALNIRLFSACISYFIPLFPTPLPAWWHSDVAENKLMLSCKYSFLYRDRSAHYVGLASTGCSVCSEAEKRTRPLKHVNRFPSHASFYNIL